MVQEIKAVGEIVVPIVLGWFGYLQMKCRQDLNIAHAKLRAKDNGTRWEDELRDNYRVFRSRKSRRKKDGAAATHQDPDKAGD